LHSLDVGFTPAEIRELVITADADKSGYLDYAEFYSRFAEDSTTGIDQQVKAEMVAREATIAARVAARNLVRMHDGEAAGAPTAMVGGLTVSASDAGAGRGAGGHRGDDDEEESDKDEEELEEDDGPGLMMISHLNTHEIMHVGDIYPIRGRMVAVHGRNMVATQPKNYPTVSCRSILVTAGKWYFEVVVREAGHGVIGWATPRYRSRGYNVGVGDCSRSWGFGCYHKRRGSAQQDTAAPKSYIKHAGKCTGCGTTWLPDDVVGCFLDMDAGVLCYTVNGKLVEGSTMQLGKKVKKLVRAAGWCCACVLRRDCI